MGVARFRLHEQAGYPVPGLWIYDGGVDPASTQEPPPCVYHIVSAVFEMYGQLAIDAPNIPQLFVVERAPFDYYNPQQVPQLWVDVSSLFVSNRDSASPRRLLLSQVLEYRPFPQTGTYPVNTFSRDYHYRVSLRPDLVRCVDVEGQPSVVPFVMEFAVLDGCFTAFDVNTDGPVNAYDIPAWLAAPTDIDTSGTANDRDLRALIHGVATWPNPQ